jgi:hypothetical protein
MIRRLRPALLAVLLGALVVSGCGIPDNTAVVPVGRGPSRGTSSGDDTTPTKSSRSDTNDKATFVLNYLTAAAGDYDSATDQARQFMSPDAAGTFKASTDIKVVRLVGSPLVNPDSPVVRIKVRPVGTLDGFGELSPSADDTVVPYSFTIDSLQGQTGLFITKAPQVLLLSDTALSTFYTRRTIYFWSLDHAGLIPDIRYMPLSVPQEQRPTEVLDWLTNGPSPWLDGVAEPLPTGTKRNGNVPAVSNDRLQISLNGQALPPNDPNALDRLQKQLRWSLRPDLPASLDLVIEHQQVEQTYTGTDYLEANAAFKSTASPERFVVYDGQIRRLKDSYRSAEAIPLLTPAANRNVRMAAISATPKRTYAALVVNEGNGGQSLRVGSAPTGEQGTLKRIALPTPIGRPVWAVSPPVGNEDSTVGLVIAGNKLFSFTAGGSAHEVSRPGGLGSIAAVAVAPDAHRVALVSGGRLYLATLSDDDSVQLSAATPIRTLMSSLTAVDWSGEGTLAVAGVKPDSGRAAIMDVSIDGAAQTDRLSDLGSNLVTYLTAFPASPTQSEDASVPMAYVLGNAAYDETAPDKIDVGDLAQPVANPRPGVPSPNAPFFLN